MVHLSALTLTVFCLLHCTTLPAFVSAQQNVEISQIRRYRGLRGFLGPLDGDAAEELRTTLKEALDMIVIGQGHDENLKRIEESLQSTFKAMPTTSGLLDASAVRHLLRRYFAREHGWTLLGLGRSDADLDSSDGSVGILQKDMPAVVAAALDAHRHSTSLTFQEVVALVAALEHLLLDEAVKLLEVAYNLNGFNYSTGIDSMDVMDLIVSYLVIYKKDKHDFGNNSEGHFRWKRDAEIHGKLNPEILLVFDTVHNFDFARAGTMNPFTFHNYPFETVVQIINVMGHQYGRWKDGYCEALRSRLSTFDSQGTGRLALQDFHSVKDIPAFTLKESLERLRLLGMLDESVPDNPRVRMANYVLSPSNCGDFSDYFQVCCSSACDSTVADLENLFQSPSIPPKLLWDTLRNQSDMSDEELAIPSSPLLGQDWPHLYQSLQAIADHHAGSVPLHGRPFATWMHFAFPRDCPLPSKTSPTPRRLSSEEWASEMELYMPLNDTTWALNETYDEQQQLPNSEVADSRTSQLLRNVVKLIVVLAMLAAALRLGLQYCRFGIAAYGLHTGRRKKEDDFQTLHF